MKIIQQVMQDKVIDITCDICGKSCLDKGEMNLEYAEISVPGGWGFYSSKDMEYHECQMCENCYDKVKNFIEIDLQGKIRISEIRGHPINLK